jgi:hypothetical protein
MIAFHTTVVLVLFTLLVAAASGDDCLSPCVGMYMCGFGYCYCPGYATESTCPYPCVFSPNDCSNDDGSDSDSDSDRNRSKDDGLSSWGILWIVVAVIILTVGLVIFVAWAFRTKSKQKSSAAHKTSTGSIAVDVEQAPCG